MMHPDRPHDTGEFIWLMSLSDLMILLFTLFVVLFSFASKNMKQNEMKQMVASITNKPAPKTQVDEVHGQIQNWIKENNLSDQISVTLANDTLEINIKDKLLFKSGDFQLQQEGQAASQELAKILETIQDPYKIAIEGHTDDVPMHSAQINDNWDLSSKRAHSVLTSMQLSPETQKRIQLLAYGEMKPILPNRAQSGESIPENQAKNRRVTVRVY